jgi:hypothetical protein
VIACHQSIRDSIFGDGVFWGVDEAKPVSGVSPCYNGVQVLALQGNHGEVELLNWFKLLSLGKAWWVVYWAITWSLAKSEELVWLIMSHWSEFATTWFLSLLLSFIFGFTFV